MSGDYKFCKADILLKECPFKITIFIVPFENKKIYSLFGIYKTVEVENMNITGE